MLDKSIGIIAIQITTMVSTTLLRGNFPGVFVLFHPLAARSAFEWYEERSFCVKRVLFAVKGGHF
jgi:hypothetical protein